MKNTTFSYFLFTVVLIGFLFLRLITLSNATVLEDHDSIFHLSTIEVFKSGDLKKIIEIDPDASLMYGFAGAIIHFFGFPLEMSGRLLSLFSAIGIFIIAFIIGKRFHSTNASITGLILITLNPVLIGLSIAILTEPFYVFMVYSGMLLFILYHRSLSLIPSFIIGLVFGISLLTRLEGILFLGFIPFMQGVFLFVENRLKFEIRKFFLWTAVFFSGFLIIATIQITWASYKMGSLAIDGRQVWTLIIHEPSDRSHVEKLLGLDYSPQHTNIGFLKANPELLYSEGKHDLVKIFKKYVKTVFLNIDDLFNNRLIQLFGFVALIFFSIGLIVMYKSGKVFEIILIFSFLITVLIPSLLHNVVIRHIFVIAPITLIVCGIGLFSSFKFFLFDTKTKPLNRYCLVFMIIALFLSVWAVSFKKVIQIPSINREYDLTVVKSMVDIINQENLFEKRATISARKGYLGYYADAKHVTIPYTDYNRLLKYLRLNDVKYLLLEEHLVRTFPFFDNFKERSYENDFQLLYEGIDKYGKKHSLFKMI